MKKSFKALSVFATALIALGGAAALASCGSGGGSTSTPTPGSSSSGGSSTSSQGKTYSMVVSGPAAQNDWLIEELAGYTALHPNVTFTTVSHGEDVVDSEVTDWEEGPDVYAYASDKILPLYQAGALATVPSVNQAWITETMGAEALEAVKFANKYVSYPYQGDNGYFLYYDSSKLSANDISSMENLLAAAGKLGLKVAYPLKTAFYSAAALFSYGCDYTVNVNDAGVVTSVDADFDNENGVLAAKAIFKIMNDVSWQDSQQAPTEANGVVACINGSWDAAKYAEDMGENYACAKLPTITIEGNTVNLSSFLGYKFYGVNPQRSATDVERLAVAHDVAKYLSDEDVQAARFDTFQAGPTNKVVKASETVQAAAHLAAIAEQTPYAHAQGAVPANIWTAPATLVTDLLTYVDGGTEPSADEYQLMMTTCNNSLKSVS